MENQFNLKPGDICHAVGCETHSFEHGAEILFVGMQGASWQHEGYYHFTDAKWPQQLLLPGEFTVTKEV